MKIEIFYKDEKIVNTIKKCLEETYGLEIVKRGEMKPINSAYNTNRGQYNASLLLDYLIKNKSEDIALWIIEEDIYYEGMNFIFGLASKNGAILSKFRLHSTELIEKEVIHEVGHILGLAHCSNECVMQFSNSIFEAIKKPKALCDECRKRIRNF